MYGKLLKDIVYFILDGKHPNLEVKENGLVYTEGRDKAVTWMNSTVNGSPVVPRTGYIVEFNALWYNALRYCSCVAADMGNHVASADMERRADLCRAFRLRGWRNRRLERASEHDIRRCTRLLTA